VICAQEPAIVDAHIVARRVGEEVALAPMSSVGPGVLHGCTFRQSRVIADPEQENVFHLEHSARVVEGLGVVYNPEPLCLPPQQPVHEDRHECAHTRWIPKRGVRVLNNAPNNALYTKSEHTTAISVVQLTLSVVYVEHRAVVV
jgi:hypothetical protein